MKLFVEILCLLQESAVLTTEAILTRSTINVIEMITKKEMKQSTIKEVLTTTKATFNR